MDVQLQELIEKIKSEGIKTAEEQAQRTRAEAQAKSDEILAGAHKSASQIIAEAQAEAVRFEQNAREGVKQAGRDMILSLKSRITEVFEALLQKESREAYTPAVLEEAVVGLVKAWAGGQTSELQVMLSPGQLGAVEKTLHSRLATEIKKGLEIRPLPGLEAGFRVGMKDGSAYYDFSDQGIAQILAEFLTPRLGEIIHDAVKG
jgi:V/A-type H+-transporting ATPase subunit E